MDHLSAGLPNTARFAALAVAALAIAGCQSQRFASLDSGPEPLRPAPTGQVTAGQQLPPPSGPTDPSSFPPAPGAATTATDPAAAGTDVAAAPTMPAPPPDAPTVTKEALLGAWKVNTAGSGCQMMLSLTKQSADYRAASLRCPGDAASVAAWNVAGQQVVLKDNSGNVVARLYSTGAERYDGQTTSGQPISFAR